MKHASFQWSADLPLRRRKALLGASSIALAAAAALSQPAHAEEGPLSGFEPMDALKDKDYGMKDDDNALMHALQQTHCVLCWMIIQSHDGSLRAAAMSQASPACATAISRSHQAACSTW
jgi:hypothetical protein